MAYDILFMDGFDHYDTGDIALKWSAGAGTISSPGRYGGGGYLLDPSSLSRTFANTQTIGIGMAVKLTVTNRELFRLRDAGTVQITVEVNVAGQVVVNRSTGTVIATSVATVTTGVWNHIEANIYIHNSAGTVDVYLNGASIISVGSLDTQNTANAYANDVFLNSADTSFDDFFVSAGADILGDCRIETDLPDGAGGVTQWTPSAGSNYQNVDDNPPDDDTTYNSSSTATQIDTFTFSNLATTSGTIYAVQVNIDARKDDAGTRTIKPVVRISASNYEGTSQNVADSYKFYFQDYNISPATSTAWGIAEINGAEFGYKLEA